MKKNQLKLEDNILVSAENIGMKFKMHPTKFDTLKERVVGLFSNNKKSNVLTVLNDVNFTIKKALLL